MAVNLDALLKLTAKVVGTEAIVGMNRALQSVSGATSAAGKAFQGLAQAGGTLTGVLGGIGGIATAAGIGNLAQQAINAGDAYFDMAQKTGVSVEMLSKFKQAADLNGTTLDAVTAALGRLSKSMVAATSGMELGRKTRREIEEAVNAVEEGERRQIQAVKDAADRRVQALEDESDRRMRELRRRYREEEQLTNDNYDDRLENEEQAERDYTDKQEKQAQRRYDLLRKQVQDDPRLDETSRQNILQSLSDREDEELKIIQRGSDARLKEIRRSNRDQRQESLDGIENRRQADEDAIKKADEAKRRQIEQSAENQRAAIAAASKAAAAELKADPVADAMSESMEEMGLNGKKAAEVFRNLGISVKDSLGGLRNPADVMLDIATAFQNMPDGAEKTALAMQLFGKSGKDLIPMLNNGGDAIRSFQATFTTEMAQRMADYDDKVKSLGTSMGVLGARIATEVLPYMEPLVFGLTKLVDWFSALPGPVRQAVLWLGLAGAAFRLIGTILGAGAISALMQGLGMLGGLLAGMISWPALVIAGLVALGVAIYVFRDQIMEALIGFWDKVVEGWYQAMGRLQGFFVGLWDVMKLSAQAAINYVVQVFANLPASIQAVWQGLSGAFQLIWEPMKLAAQAAINYVVQVFANLPASIQAVTTGLGDAFAAVWNGVKTRAEAFGKWWDGFVSSLAANWNTVVVNPIRNAWTGLVQFLQNSMNGIATAVRNTWNGIVSTIRGVMNSITSAVTGAVNAAIGALNNLIDRANAALALLRIGVQVPRVGTISAPANAAPAAAPARQPISRTPLDDAISSYNRVLSEYSFNGPRYASGGYVNRATLAMVGEGGEPEYIVPASKMATASRSYLAGARGASVLSGSGSIAGVPSTVMVDIRTGPVYEMNGQQMVTIQDVENVAMAAAHGVLRQLQRSPAVRQNLGVA